MERPSGIERDRCVYCGAKADTREHVPPRCFLEQPLPSDLLTVPACSQCNGGYSLDEQYAVALLSLIGAGDSLAAKIEPGGSVNRAFLRRPAFEQRFLARMQVDEAGGVFIEPENERLDLVMKKTVAGLYWAKYQRPVHTGALGPIGFWRHDVDNSVPASVFMSTYTERFTPKRRSVVQPHVFLYVFAKQLDGRLACVIDWHETLWVACTVPFPSGRASHVAPTGQAEQLPFDEA